MGLPVEKGIGLDPNLPLASPVLIWLRRLVAAFPRTRTYNTTLTPASVAANSTAEQTFSVQGLATTDVVTVNKPSYTSGIGIVNARVPLSDTLAVTFVNLTGSPIVPPQEAYRVIATRL